MFQRWNIDSFQRWNEIVNSNAKMDAIWTKTGKIDRVPFFRQMRGAYKPPPLPSSGKISSPHPHHFHNLDKQPHF